jgi:hypothetical protein
MRQRSLIDTLHHHLHHLRLRLAERLIERLARATLDAAACSAASEELLGPLRIAALSQR